MKGITPKIRMLCFVLTALFETFQAFGSCFRTPAVIFVSDFCEQPTVFRVVWTNKNLFKQTKTETRHRKWLTSSVQAHSGLPAITAVSAPALKGTALPAN